MPAYDYQCEKCRKQFVVQQSLQEHDRHKKPECPRCGSKQVDRLVTAVHVQTSKKT